VRWPISTRPGATVAEWRRFDDAAPAKRAQKVVYLPQSLPQGVHLHALESVIVARRASGF
jgi:ABC-type cobalamin/Fe3+-siderophores transport system ATPase subunit